MNQFNSTQITITFTTDNDRFLLSLLFIFWLIQKAVYKISHELMIIKSDFVESLFYTGKVLAIGFNSLIWGLK